MKKVIVCVALLAVLLVGSVALCENVNFEKRDVSTAKVDPGGGGR